MHPSSGHSSILVGIRPSSALEWVLIEALAVSAVGNAAEGGVFRLESKWRTRQDSNL